MGMINEAAKNYLASLNLDVASVTNIYDDTYSSGFCETCYHESVVVVIDYRDSGDKSKSYTYYGGFADFINTLDSFTEE